MAEFSGSLVFDPVVTRAEIPGRAPGAYDHATPLPKLFVDDPAVLAAPFAGFGTDAHQEDAENVVLFGGIVGLSATPGFDFYERFHVIPRRLDFGNVLSTTTTPLEVFSAFRSLAQFWSMFDNNAGAGVTLVGAPSLPVLVQPQGGFLLSVQVDLNGPAVVDSTLDFTFSSTGLIQIPITLQRVVLFAAAPELPYEEILEFATDVLAKVDGTEQRVSLRKNPRQLFSWDVFLDDGPERSLFENILFEWQTRVFGLPVWHEATPLTAAVTGGSTTTITVSSTADADFRDGGLILIYESPTKFDVLNLVSHTATTLVVENPPANSYTVLADLRLVTPLRLAVSEGAVRGSRYRLGQDRYRFRFRVKDNDANLASTAAYSTFNSKVLLDDFNFVDGQMPEEFAQDVISIDGDTGLTDEFTRQSRHRRASAKGFAVSTKAGLWQVRQLLHALRGRQVSFYLPTFSRDLTPIATMTSGLTTLAITNVGYTNFVQTRQPKNVIRVTPVTGASFLRTIVSSLVVSAVQENITVDTAWPSTLTPAQIDKISFVEKVRQDSDAIRIRHERGGNARRIAMPVRTVLE